MEEENVDEETARLTGEDNELTEKEIEQDGVETTLTGKDARPDNVHNDRWWFLVVVGFIALTVLIVACSTPTISKVKVLFDNFRPEASPKDARDSSSNMIMLKPRAFVPWKENHDKALPCSEYIHRPYEEDKLSKGMLYVRTRTTVSTGHVMTSGRIARNRAQRLDRPFPFCSHNMNHGNARLKYSSRDKRRSFLYSVIRDPTTRALETIRRESEPAKYMWASDAELVDLLRQHLSEYKNFYIRYLTFDSNATYNRRKAAEEILAEYDFLGVAERLDESLVALAKLLDLNLADILRLCDRPGDGHTDEVSVEDPTFGGVCLPAIQRNVTNFPKLEAYIESTEWQDAIMFDRALHQAANRSLDLTINRLGRKRFEKALSQYRQARSVATGRCGSSNDAFYKKNCKGNTHLHSFHSECREACLDEVSTELGLW